MTISSAIKDREYDKFVTDSLGNTAVRVIMQITGDHSILDNLDYASSGHSGFEPTIGHVTEDITNKVTSLSSGSTDTEYPSAKLVYDGLDLKLDSNAPILASTNTKITYDINGLITSGTSALTSDIPDSTDKRYVTDNGLIVLSNTSGVNTGDETNATIKTKLGAATAINDGYLTSADWTTFSSAALPIVDAPLTGNGTSGDHIRITSASSGADGYLTNDDWILFNSKLSSNAPITASTATKVSYDTNGLVTSGSSATTSDIPDSSNYRYCTDAQKVVIGNTSNTNSGDDKINAANTTTNAFFYPVIVSAQGTTVTSNSNATLKYNPSSGALVAAKFYIGLSSGASIIHIDNALLGAALKFTCGATTGQTATDGFDIGVDTSANGEIRQRENLPIIFYTNNTEAARILAGGNFAIGAATASQKLDVAGKIALTGVKVLEQPFSNTIVVGDGATSLTHTTSSTGYFNTILGMANATALTTGRNNVIIGYAAGAGISTGYENIAIGQLAMSNSTCTGNNNVSIGIGANANLTGDTLSVAIGRNANSSCSGKSKNTAVGAQSIANNNGNNNTAIGYTAGGNYGGSSTAFSNCINIGYYSGNYNETTGKLYIDSFDRANTAGDDAGAIITGLMDSTPSNQWLRINAKFGIFLASPTAYLHLPAGSTVASTAPIKLTSGSLMTNPEAGAIEFLSDKYYATTTTGPIRKEIQLYDTYYGEAYFYTATGAASTSLAIDTSLIYHAIVLASSAGINAGFTHKAGQANAIASVAENSAGVSYKVTTTGNHNLIAGECITHTGFTTRTTYRGKFVVQSTPSATEYIVLGTYLGTDTGFMKRGYSLRANTGSAGVYRITHSLSASVANSNTTFKLEMNINTTELDNIASEKRFGSSAELDTITNSGMAQIADGDYIWMSIANMTDATDFSVRHSNITLNRV